MAHHERLVKEEQMTLAKLKRTSAAGLCGARPTAEMVSEAASVALIICLRPVLLRVSKDFMSKVFSISRSKDLDLDLVHDDAEHRKYELDLAATWNMPSKHDHAGTRVLGAAFLSRSARMRSTISHLSASLLGLLCSLFR